MDRARILQDTPYKEKNGVYVITAPTAVSANKIVRKILDNYSDSKTALFLSGGNTPKKLYGEIALGGDLKAGAVLMVDERFGKKLHKKSNELMIKDTNLLEYFDKINVRFYSILQSDVDIENTSLQYDETLRFLLKFFPKTVGILGIGNDSHTAGIPAISNISKRILEDQSSLVTYYDENDNRYGGRITMTFLALSQLDLIILLVLGQEKREALRKMFSDGPIEEIPARFYLQPKIAEKTILITDQIV